MIVLVCRPELKKAIILGIRIIEERDIPNKYALNNFPASLIVFLKPKSFLGKTKYTPK